MNQKSKLLNRFLTRSHNFTWRELVRLLRELGFTETRKGKTGGSRRRFIHQNGVRIFLHKPHPGNLLKRYQVDQIIDLLEQENFI